MTSRNKREGRYAGWFNGQHFRMHFYNAKPGKEVFECGTLWYCNGWMFSDNCPYGVEILRRSLDVPNDAWFCFNSNMTDEEIDTKFAAMVKLAQESSLSREQQELYGSLTADNGFSLEDARLRFLQRAEKELAQQD